MNNVIDKRFNAQKQKLVEALSEVDYVAVTIDIWSDRTVRSFLGVTVHYILQSKLCSSLLACKRLSGKIIDANDFLLQLKEL